MSIRRSEGANLTSTTTVKQAAKKSKVGQAVKGVTQTSEQMQTSIASTSNSQSSDKELTGEALRAMGIEGAIGGLSIRELSTREEITEDISTSSPFDPDREEKTAKSAQWYDDWNDHDDATARFVPNVLGWKTQEQKWRILIIQRPPPMFYALVGLASSYGAEVGEIHKDERNRMSVELLKMPDEAEGKFSDLAMKHHEKLLEKQNRKKDEYKKQTEQNKKAKHVTHAKELESKTDEAPLAPKQNKKQARHARKQETHTKTRVDASTFRHKNQTRHRN